MCIYIYFPKTGKGGRRKPLVLQRSISTKLQASKSYRVHDQMLFPTSFYCPPGIDAAVALPKPLNQLHRQREAPRAIPPGWETVQDRPLGEDVQSPCARRREGWVKAENLIRCPQLDPPLPQGGIISSFLADLAWQVRAHSLHQLNPNQRKTFHVSSPRKSKSPT